MKSARFPSKSSARAAERLAQLAKEQMEKAKLQSAIAEIDFYKDSLNRLREEKASTRLLADSVATIIGLLPAILVGIFGYYLLNQSNPWLSFTGCILVLICGFYALYSREL